MAAPAPADAAWYARAMGNAYGITLDDASLRWAAAESVPETVIAAICLLETMSVDEIVARLTPAELEQVIKIVGRSPRGYPPGAYDALKGEQHRRSTEPPAQRLSPKAAAKEQAGRVREDTDRVRRGHTRRPMDGRQSYRNYAGSVERAPGCFLVIDNETEVAFGISIPIRRLLGR